MAERVVHPTAGPFAANVEVPGDKSLSHRALLLAAMARGSSEVRHLGPGSDVRSTAAAVTALGARFEGTSLVSPGVDGWVCPSTALDCGNSGTSMRLLAGALAGRQFMTDLVGDASLSRRPMERVAVPLRSLGADVETSPDGTPPVRVGGGNLVGTNVQIAVASAQVRSSFELAAIQAEGVSEIDGPPGFRDHTERMLESKGLGERVTRTLFRVLPSAVDADSYTIPGDPSSAAFLWASAALIPGAMVTTRDISLNPGRIGFLEVLSSMGAGVEAEVTRAFHGDPVGTVTVSGAGLHAATLEGELVVATIDELPLVAVLGVYAEGITRVTGAAELRTKESDRIIATVEMIRALGGGAEETEDGFTVVGTGFLVGGGVDSQGDHRMAMAAAVAATMAEKPVTILRSESAAVSWPGFYDALETLWSSR